MRRADSKKGRYLFDMVLLRERSRPKAGIVEPCLPTLAKKPSAGKNWILEIEHDGFRIMARRDSVGVRLITRNGHDFSNRFPFIALAVGHLPARSCLVDGEAIVTGDHGLANFELMRSRRIHATAVLCAFDLLELDGEICALCRLRSANVYWRSCCVPRMPVSHSISITMPMAPPCSRALVRSAAKASCQSGSARRTGQAEQTIG
jgi:ATP-dependent DNA ligase